MPAKTKRRRAHHGFLLNVPIMLMRQLRDLATRNRRPITTEVLIAVENHLEASRKESNK